MGAQRPADGFSLTEWAVLGLLREQSSHPFAIARHLATDGDLGRVLTVRRPLVYRALDRLVEAGLAEPHHTEPGDAGPRRTVHRITPKGRIQARRWLECPVDHVRELRLEFLLKVAFVSRSGGSISRLVANQRMALRRTVEALLALPDEPDAADLWRHHQAAATLSFLEDMTDRTQGEEAAEETR